MIISMTRTILSLFTMHGFYHGKCSVGSADFYISTSFLNIAYHGSLRAMVSPFRLYDSNMPSHNKCPKKIATKHIIWLVAIFLGHLL